MNLITFQVIIVVPLHVIYFIVSMRNQGDNLTFSVNRLNKKFFVGGIDNNFVAYLIDKKRESYEFDLLLTLSYIFFFVTIFIILITFCAIQIYLKCKHSKSIEIAEKISNKKYKQILTFKNIFFCFLMFSICFGISFKVNVTGPRRTSDVPPTLILNNLICNCLIIYYVVFRREVSQYLWRKLLNNQLVFSLRFPRKRNLNSINPIQT